MPHVACYWLFRIEAQRLQPQARCGLASITDGLQEGARCSKAVCLRNSLCTLPSLSDHLPITWHATLDRLSLFNWKKACLNLTLKVSYCSRLSTR